MSPHTRLVPLLVGVAALAACGSPAKPSATPTYASAAPSIDASLPPPTLTPVTPATEPPIVLPTADPLTTYTANPGYGLTQTQAAETTAPLTVPATPTPSHAPKCTTTPTSAQILALIKGQPGIPKTTLKVSDGPYCADGWSFAAVIEAAKSADQQDPLMVVAYGSSSLELVIAGSDACNDPVQTSAPAGIRVLACGF